MILRFALLWAVLALGAGTAAAQGPAAGSDWTGAYGGVSFGFGATRGEARVGSFQGAIIERDVELGILPSRVRETTLGPVAGVALGYDLRQGRIVAGVALGLSFGGLSADNRFVAADPADFGLVAPAHPFGGTETTTRFRTRTDGLAALTGRVGVASGETLFYVTAGLAAGRVANRLSLRIDDLNPLVGIGDADGTYANAWSRRGVRVGYIVGAGIERMVAPGTSLQIEVSHVDLADTRLRASDGPNFGTQRVDYRFTNRGQLARIGLNFRF